MTFAGETKENPMQINITINRCGAQGVRVDLADEAVGTEPGGRPRFQRLDEHGIATDTDALTTLVRDNDTGLIWTHAANIAAARVNHAAAAEAASKLRYMDRADWRLPTIEELFLLADRSRFKPAIDTDAFPDTRSDWYWASSLCAGYDDYAWIVNFWGGSAHWGHRGHDVAYVRAVRGPVPAASQ